MGKYGDKLILSAIFHYEFVFIHPFDDRNLKFTRDGVSYKKGKILKMVSCLFY